LPLDFNRLMDAGQNLRYGKLALALAKSPGKNRRVVQIMELQILELGSLWNLELEFGIGIWNLEFGIWNFGIGVWSQHSTIRIDLAGAAWWTTAPWPDHCVWSGLARGIT